MIQSLKRRSIRSLAGRQARARVESKDAILWDVLPDERKCRVKVQDSNTLLVCHYPENWKKVPDWLKVGNSVRIMHAGGNQRRFEIVGSGMTVPTQWKHATSTDTWAPSVAQGEDCVLTGCLLRQLPDTVGMFVTVDNGTYRISGTVYTLDGGMNMAETSNVDMTSGVSMSSTSAVVPIAAASSTKYRMDAVVIAADGVVDVVQGVASDNDPQLPGIPNGHIMLGWVYLPPGTTAITQDLINRAYVAPFASQLEVTTAADTLDWATDHMDITVRVLDQYGLVLSGVNWRIKAEITSGTGQWYQTGDTVERIVSISSSQTSGTLTYWREYDYDNPVDPPTEECPVFIAFTLENDPMITQHTVLLLLDSGGFAIV